MQDWNFTVSWVDGQEANLQVPDMLSRLVSNPEETETSIDAETAVLVVAVAQVDMPLFPHRVCHYFLTAQCDTRTLRGRYHLETIAWWRFCLPESRIERAHIHSKITTLSTNESDQTVSQSKTIHLCGPYWPTSDRRGRIPVYTGSDLCVLTLDRTFFSN